MIIDENIVKSIMDRIEKIEMAGTRSEYKDNDGKRVPRVTEVLSAMLHNDGLMHWANNLGWKRISYRAFMKEAADKGTYSHLAVEKYLRNGKLDLNDLNIPNNNIFNTVRSCMDGFMSWWTKMHKEHNEIEVVYLEETLIHPYFGGTCDCLLKVDGKYWLIDFKTSNHMNYNYILQLAAYRYLLKELKDIDVDICMVLRLDKTEHCYYDYILNLEYPDSEEFMDNCLQTFMILVAGFKMRLFTTDKYNELFKSMK